jgi:hypothetical protein
VEEPIAYEYIDVMRCAVKKAYLEVEPELSLLERSVGGFKITSVNVTTWPSLLVDLNVVVISRGAYEVVCPRLLVVWRNTVVANVELELCHDYGDARQRKEINTYLGREVRVLEVELGVDVLSLLLGLGELVETSVEVVAVEKDWGVEVACEGLLEGVAEVLDGVLTGELLGDEDWEGDCVSDDSEEELGGAELAGEVNTDSEDVGWEDGGLGWHSKN